VALPDSITRVSEYVPEIVQFIEKIIENGYAYSSNGSVYFDVKKYSEEPDHTYAKLEPTSVNNKEKMAEGEGVLTNSETTEKRNPTDFALWKGSKPGEPVWPSPWGEGRPGWHIECSAMAASLFRKYPIDIHCGGVDLRFPHHDNEIAQSEAYYKCDNWINHFWHTGHLHIEGKKMSKSLKNFITINKILEDFNPRQVRFVFLIHTWSSMMNYTTEKSLPQAINVERKFTEFFRSVKAATRNSTVRQNTQNWKAQDEELSGALYKT
jgi:cysteinyl-tRNA synthetase